MATEIALNLSASMSAAQSPAGTYSYPCTLTFKLLQVELSTMPVLQGATTPCAIAMGSYPYISALPVPLFFKYSYTESKDPPTQPFKVGVEGSPQERTYWIDSGVMDLLQIFVVIRTDSRGAIMQQEPHWPWVITAEALHDQSMMMLGGTVTTLVLYRLDFAFTSPSAGLPTGTLFPPLPFLLTPPFELKVGDEVTFVVVIVGLVMVVVGVVIPLVAVVEFRPVSVLSCLGRTIGGVGDGMVTIFFPLTAVEFGRIYLAYIAKNSVYSRSANQLSP